MECKTHYLSQEYRRLVFSKTFILLLALNFVLLIYPFLYEVYLAHGVRNIIFYYTGSVFWTRNIVLNIVITTALVCKSIPDDLNTGMVRYIVSRICRQQYIYLKALSLLLATLTLLLSSNLLRILLVYVITRFPIVPIDPTQVINQYRMNDFHLLMWGFTSPILFYLRKTVITALFINMWVIAGSIVSAKYSNIYLTLSFPAIIYYLLINIFSRLFKTEYLNLTYLTTDELNLGSLAISSVYPIVLFLLLNVLFYFLLTFTLRRRIYEL